MTTSFSTAITIDTTKAKVWTSLTDPETMATWLGEPEMQIDVQTDWQVGCPIFIRGFHHIPFENKGVVLHYDAEVRLAYSHLSSISRLADEPTSYSILEFSLAPSGNQTLLTLTISNFPTETIRKHLEFYWRTTMLQIKQIAETADNRKDPS